VGDYVHFHPHANQRRHRRVFMAVDSDNNTIPVPERIPFLMAMAEDDAPQNEDSWLQRRQRNPKRLGERSQAEFLVKAHTLGMSIAVPWGDSEKYDFIVSADPRRRLFRVQVKATGRLYRGAYDVQPVYSTRNEGKKTYTAADIDVLAAHVQGKNVWYLVPIKALAGIKNLRLFPDLKARNPRWEKFREAWHWLGLTKPAASNRK
jgi:PD-(D/E)XK endonuclease